MAHVHALTLRSKRPCKNWVIAIKHSPRLQDTQGASLIFVLLVKSRLHSLTICPSTFPSSGKGINSVVVIQVCWEIPVQQELHHCGQEEIPRAPLPPPGETLQRAFCVCKMLGKVGNKCVQDLQTFYLIPLGIKAWAYYCSLPNKS